MNKDWQVRASTVFGFTMILIFLGFLIPIGIQYVAPFIGLFYFFKLKKAGRIKRFDWIEILLFVVYSLALLLASTALAIFVVNSIPWIKIILVGMAADIISSLLGTVPGFGDITSAVLVFILGVTIIGGIQGIVLALIIGLIALIPGPSLGANTLFLVGFKLLTLLLAGVF